MRLLGTRAALSAALLVLILLAGTVSGASSARASDVDQSPQGDAAWVVGEAGLVQAFGWVFDRSDFGVSVEVLITVDGVPAVTASAFRASDYLYTYGVPGSHAYWTALTVLPGNHTVCPVWRNVGAGADVQGTCVEVVVPDETPVSWPQGDLAVSMDNEAGHAVVMGWAFDHSALAASIDVDVYVDGRHRGRWNAGLDSPYLYPYGVPGRHAFFGAVAMTTGEHDICVVARDRAPGADAPVGCRRVTAQIVAHHPEGSIGLSMNANGSFTISGWAFDRSDLGRSIQVAVFQNGTLTAAPYAAGSSPQLAPYGVFNKGVDVRIPPVTRSEPIELCVLGLNIGTGDYRWLACGSFDPRGTRAVEDQTSASSFTVLVNKRTPLSPERYSPPLLALSSVGVGGGQALRPEAAYAMRGLVSHAAASGIGLQVASGYRSYDTQVSVFNRYVRERGVAGAELTSARPGYSEHQTGLAADVTAPAEGCSIAQCFGSTRAGQWLAANAWQYGFIIRYPNGYTSTTGYEWEPWHLRYAGSAVAREMHDGGFATYEQYLGAPSAPGY